MNPGPKLISKESFSTCHWNLNNIAAHNYNKIPLLKEYTAVYKFDIISLSETYLPVDTRRHFNVYTTSIRRRRRRIDVL